MEDAQGASGPPEVVVLDVNGTLSDLEGIASRFAAAGLGSDLVPLWMASTLRDGFALTAAGGSAKFSDIATYTLAGMLAGVTRGADGVVDVAAQVVSSMAQLDLHPDVAGSLERLREAGVRVITLSNGSAQVADSLLRRAGLRELVEQCLSVEEVGRWKPAGAAYAYAARRCDVDVARMALIAVHPWDIDGALRAGMRAGWLARDPAPYPGHFRRPEATASSMVELARIFTSHR